MGPKFSLCNELGWVGLKKFYPWTILPLDSLGKSPITYTRSALAIYHPKGPAATEFLVQNRHCRSPDARIACLGRWIQLQRAAESRGAWSVYDDRRSASFITFGTRLHLH